MLAKLAPPHSKREMLNSFDQIKKRWFRSCVLIHIPTKQGDDDRIIACCWPTVYNGEPISSQHWIRAQYLVGPRVHVLFSLWDRLQDNITRICKITGLVTRAFWIMCDWKCEAPAQNISWFPTSHPTKKDDRQANETASCCTQFGVRLPVSVVWKKQNVSTPFLELDFDVFFPAIKYIPAIIYKATGKNWIRSFWRISIMSGCLHKSTLLYKKQTLLLIFCNVNHK